MNEEMRVRRELDPCDVDAGGGRGSLVRAHGEHLLAEQCCGAGWRRAGTARPRRRGRRNRAPGSGACRRARGTRRSSRCSTPTSLGCSTGEPRLPAPHVELANPNCSMATTPASVTTARLTPRTRRADAPTIRPSTTPATEPASGPHGKPMPASTSRCDTVNPETPASVTCASDTWPDEPRDHDQRQADHHADERQHQRLPVAERQHDQQHDTDDGQTTVGRASRCGRGAAGSRFSTSSPRVGRLAPAQRERRAR